MNQVFSNLWIGDANDGRDANALRSHNIKIVVNETNETDSLGGQFEYVRLNQQDGQPILKSTLLLFLTSLCGMRMAHPEGGILIHCGAGVSRASSFTIAWLMFCGMSWQAAEFAIRCVRPQIQPHPELKKSVLEFFSA